MNPVAPREAGSLPPPWGERRWTMVGTSTDATTGVVLTTRSSSAALRTVVTSLRGAPRSFLGWSSGGTVPLVRQPSRLRAVVHDGPPLLGLANWRRALPATLDQALADVRAGGWEGVGLEEFVIGRHDPADWIARCRAARSAGTPVMLAWNAEWGAIQESEPDPLAVVRQALGQVGPAVDVLAVELYLDGRSYGKQGLRAGQLLEASVEAGVWPQTLALFNVSDDPQQWSDEAREYAVFDTGELGQVPGAAARYAVQATYQQIWRQMLGLGYGRELGYWATEYVSELSVRTLDTILDGAGSDGNGG